MAYLQIFLGFLIIGYSTVKYVKSGFELDSVNLPAFAAVGILLPLSSLFGLKRAKAEEERQKEPDKEKESLNVHVL